MSLSDLISGTGNLWTLLTQYFHFHQVIVEPCQASVNQILDVFFSEESFNFIIADHDQAGYAMETAPDISFIYPCLVSFMIIKVTNNWMLLSILLHCNLISGYNINITVILKGEKGWSLLKQKMDTFYLYPKVKAIMIVMIMVFCWW